MADAPEGDEGEKAGQPLFVSFRPPGSGRTDVVGKVPKSIRPSAATEPPSAQQIRRQKVEAKEGGSRHIGSEPPAPEAAVVEIPIEIPPLAPLSIEGLDALDPPDAPVASDPLDPLDPLDPHDPLDEQGALDELGAQNAQNALEASDALNARRVDTLPLTLPLDDPQPAVPPQGPDETRERRHPAPGTIDPTERIRHAKKVMPIETPAPIPSARGGGKLIVFGGVLVAAAAVGAALWWAVPAAPTAATEDGEGPSPSAGGEAETPTAPGSATETGTGTVPAAPGAGIEDGDGPGPSADREAATPTESGSTTETGTETESEPDLHPDGDLAALPTPRAEVLRENPWVRRNRAANLRQEARRLYLNGRVRAAHREFLHSLEWDPTNVDAMRFVSRTLQRLGDMDAALAWARRCVDTQPANPRNHELLGDQLLMLERTEEAIAAYETGVEVAPSDVRLRSRLRRLR